MSALVEKDAWLSRRLDKTAYRLDITGGRSRSLGDILRKLEKSELGCFVYCKVPVTDLPAADCLWQNGFRLVETALTLQRAIDPGPGSAHRVRCADGRDAAQVEQIARTSFRWSRFHTDPAIASRTADDVKAQWAANFFKGLRGDTMAVAEYQGRVSGFAQLLYCGDRVVIDLIAVDRAARRQGLAAGMIGFILENHAGFATLRTGTQVANLAAVRLYETLGFRMVKADHVFHYHSPLPTHL